LDDDLLLELLKAHQGLRRAQLGCRHRSAALPIRNGDTEDGPNCPGALVPATDPAKTAADVVVDPEHAQAADQVETGQRVVLCERQRDITAFDLEDRLPVIGPELERIGNPFAHVWNKSRRRWRLD